jgi:hypothetical protein
MLADASIEARVEARQSGATGRRSLVYRRAAI